LRTRHTRQERELPPFYVCAIIRVDNEWSMILQLKADWRRVLCDLSLPVATVKRRSFNLTDKRIAAVWLTVVPLHQFCTAPRIVDSNSIDRPAPDNTDDL